MKPRSIQRWAPIADHAEELHVEQQQDGDAIGQARHVAPEPDRHHGHDQHGNEPQREAFHLRLGPAAEIPAGNRVEHEKAETGDRDQQ